MSAIGRKAVDGKLGAAQLQPAEFIALDLLSQGGEQTRLADAGLTKHHHCATDPLLGSIPGNRRLIELAVR